MELTGSADRKADRVADDLLRRIVSGSLPAGGLLPRENELAAEHGVNRGVVREAVKLLEVHRLVRPQRRRGTEVLDPLASLSPEVLRAMLEPRPGEVDVHVLADLLEVRAALDEQMTTLAATRRTDADLAALERAVIDLEAADGAEAYARALARLALATAHATHNRIYPMLMHWHARIVADFGPLFRSVRSPSEAQVQGTRLLLDLIRARDTDGVRSLVRAYHSWATPRLLEAAAAGPLTETPAEEIA